jgi:hypothetical protein
LWHSACDIQQCVYSPETFKCGVDDNFGRFDLTQIERKGSGSAPIFQTAMAPFP